MACNVELSESGRRTEEKRTCRRGSFRTAIFSLSAAMCACVLLTDAQDLLSLVRQVDILDYSFMWKTTMLGAKAAALRAVMIRAALKS